MKSKRIIYGIFIVLSLSMFSTITISYSGLKTSQGKIFNNFSADYLFGFMGVVENTRFDYHHVSEDYYNVTWTIADVIDGTWIENKENRLIINSSGGMSFNDGTHSAIWIFTNITISNITLITIDGVGDLPFQVVDDLNATIFGIGDVEAWYLINLIIPGSYAIYEKNTGLLIYGYFDWGADFYTLQLTNTNMFSHYAPSGGIPGFSLFVIIPTILIVSIILVKKKMKNK